MDGHPAGSRSSNGDLGQAAPTDELASRSSRSGGFTRPWAAKDQVLTKPDKHAVAKRVAGVGSGRQVLGRQWRQTQGAPIDDNAAGTVPAVRQSGESDWGDL